MLARCWIGCITIATSALVLSIEACASPISASGPGADCGHNSTAVVTLSGPELFTAPLPAPGTGSGGNRTYDWFNADMVRTVCTNSIGVSDSVHFTVATSGAIPAGFKVVASVTLGDQYTTILNQASAPGGFLFTGVVKYFSTRSSAGMPYTDLSAALELAFPPVGSADEDRALLQQVLKSITVKFFIRAK